jgi:hypothetical protein
MEWQEIRAHYPHQWLLVEALKARSEDNKRVLERLAVLGSYPDSPVAMKAYTELHREAPTRELYVFHTSREQLDVTERRRLGIRLVNWLSCAERRVSARIAEDSEDKA